MKLRKLRKLLNDTTYIISRDTAWDRRREEDSKEPRICIGSSMVHDLIAYNTVTKKFTTAVFNPGERHKDADELMFIWNKMHELAESGQLDEIASGDDELKDPVPVFSFRDQKIVKTFTERDEFGWPHCDNEGYLMYDNTAFRTERECRLYAIGLLISNLDFCLQNLESDIEQLARRVKFFSSEAKALRQLYKEMRKDENASADKQPDGM